MKIFVYTAGSDFYIKMATLCCISHKRANPKDNVVLLTSEEQIKEEYENALLQEKVSVSYYPSVKTELGYIANDGDMARFHTFARWQCYLYENIKCSDGVHALLDPDIVSISDWSDVAKAIEEGTIAFTRQYDWDNFINGGFIIGYKRDMNKIGQFLVDQIQKDVSAGAFIRPPYDQIYWNRYYNTFQLSNICLGTDFIKLAFDRNIHNAKLIHQIDYKGFLFKYPVMKQIADDYKFFITEKEMEKY